MKFVMISAAELEKVLRYENSVLVDLRNASEYRKSHIQGAVNIPFQQLEHQDLSKIFNKNKYYILYCERGSTSLELCRTLMEMGIRAASLRGGYYAYRQKNRW